MKVSIITVCRNSDKTIERTLQSILEQTYRGEIEYLIIDGLSTDRTLDIISSYRESFLKRGVDYKVISEKDSGIYNAMNKGINAATGDIVGIINSDDWYERDAVKTVVSNFAKNPFDVLCGGTYLWKGSEKIREKKTRYRRYVTSRDWNHPGMFVRGGYYTEAGTYREDVFYADLDFYFRARRNGASIHYIKKTLSNFQLGGISNRKNIADMVMRIRDRYHVYRSNGYSAFYLIESCAQEAAKFILA